MVEDIFSCSPVDGKVDKQLLTQHHECLVDRHLLHNFQLPTLDHNLPRGQHPTCCSVTDLHTWLGAVACGIDVGGGTPHNDYVSTYRTPEPHARCQYGTRVRWTGMVHSDWVCDLLCRAR